MLKSKTSPRNQLTNIDSPAGKEKARRTAMRTGLEINMQIEDQTPTARKQIIELKWKRVLRALVHRPHLNRFEAETAPEIRDHCLNSTIPEIERKGIVVDRRQVKLHGYGGAPVFCAEYSLDDDNRERAKNLLAGA
jgi:hypothetical protein